MRRPSWIILHLHQSRQMKSNTVAGVEWLEKQVGELVKVGLTDIDGVLRAKYLHRSKVRSALEKGFGFCDVVFGWDIQDQLYESMGTSAGPTAAESSTDTKSGFPDAQARLVPESCRNIPWENDLPFVLADLYQSSSPLAAACPRSLLIKVVQRAEALGFEARFGPEYEWFAYHETPVSLAGKDYRDLQPLSPGMFGYSGLRTSQRADFLHELFKQLAAFQVELEGLHTETGPGVLEAAILHQPTLEAADRAQLFKQSVKEISYRHGLLSSFMAKPFADLPGCGGHLHQSLWRDGQNLFHTADRPHKMSKHFEHYLAGQLAALPYLMPLLAPTVNSYKRYVSGSWAATRMNWGIDNRTVALRVIPGDEQSTRLETRLPGADANPYLAIAASLAAGLYGIEQELPLDTPAVSGSAYDQHFGFSLAPNLVEATAQMRSSELPPQLLGKGFVDHFLKTRDWEWQQYQKAVTDWERKRYFELA